MAKNPFQIDNLIIHIGPHKTGTTSVQKLLHDNASLLRERGIYYPHSPLLDGAHHHVPFHLLGWSLGSLGFVESPAGPPEAISLSSELQDWLTDAQQLSCATVIVSAEDFCGLGEAEWASFARILADAEEGAGISIATITICLTERSLDERVASQFAEYLKHGLAQSFDDVNETLREKLATRDAAVAAIPGAFNKPVRLQRLTYNPPDSSDSFLHHWVAEALGENALGALPAESFTTTVNHRILEHSQARLLEFNQLNTPASADIFTPFNDASIHNDERERARQRLGMMVNLVAELESAPAEANRRVAQREAQLAQAQADLQQASTALLEVRSTLSWRITKPLRAVRGVVSQLRRRLS